MLPHCNCKSSYFPCSLFHSFQRRQCRFTSFGTCFSIGKEVKIDLGGKRLWVKTVLKPYRSWNSDKSVHFSMSCRRLLKIDISEWAYWMTAINSRIFVSIADCMTYRSIDRQSVVRTIIQLSNVGSASEIQPIIDDRSFDRLTPHC